LHVGELPPQCAALNRTFLNVAELTVRAALEGRRDHIVQAAMLDPNTAATLTLDGIDRLVADMLEAHADRLPPSLKEAS
jgi:alpha-galactosidase